MVKMGLGLSENSNYDRNVPIMVKIKGKSTSDDLPLAIYDIFLTLLRFQPVFLAEIAIFEGENGVEAV